MIVNRFPAVVFLLIAIAASAGCGKKAETPIEREKPTSKPIGSAVTHLGVHVGSIWGDGYSVDVVPEDYVVVEHRNCPNAKEANVPSDSADGFCVVRITKEQSTRFETAMERFKKNSIPLESFSFEAPYVRPDGKPCKSQWTDHRVINLLWTGTEGVKIATFYEGCDRDEFEAFYKSVLAVTDPLPIKQIIENR